MNRASTALGDTAAEFCAGKADPFPDNPKEWSGRVYVDVMALAIDRECNHDVSLSSLSIPVGIGTNPTAWMMPHQGGSRISLLSTIVQESG